MKQIILLILIFANNTLAVEVDPFENYNRKVFSFNERVDSYLIKPVASFYNLVTPGFLDDGITNIFRNLNEPVNIVNNGLQFKYSESAISFMRFLTNTIFGIGGFIDVATHVGLKYSNEDFGQTLAIWGIESGPYIVLPFLGGKSIRDTLSILPDNYLSITNSKIIHHDQTRYHSKILEVIDIRSDLMDAEKLISGDKYIFLRDVYFQKRMNDIYENENENLDGFDSDF
jgi:phospholipid-binding lipoprotein MlaA